MADYRLETDVRDLAFESQSGRRSFIGVDATANVNQDDLTKSEGIAVTRTEMINAPPIADGRNQQVNGLIAVSLMFITISVSIFTTIESAISFIDEDPWSALSLTLTLTAATAFCVWVTWKYLPNNGRISSLFAGMQYALAAPLLFNLAVLSHGPRGSRFSDEACNLQDGYLAGLAVVMAGLAYGRWKVRQPTLAKPRPRSWQTASYIVYSYGTPLWVFVGLAAGLTVVAACLWFAVGYEEGFSGRSTGQFYQIDIWGPVLYLLSVIVICHLARSKFRARFPDEPYIWLTASGLNVRDRLFLDWTKVTRIEFHWERQRAGKRKTGLDIYSPEFNTGECVTIPFFNATVKPDKAMDAIKALQQAKHISFDDE